MHRSRLAPALLAPLLAAALTACGSDDEGGDASTATPSTGATESASPSGTGASQSASPPGQAERDASVSAEGARIRASASAQLQDAEGRGNAASDVSLQGVATARTDGQRTALVRVTNSTDEEAFYAVQVDFVAEDGTVVDSVVTGFTDVDPGERVERYVSSRKAGQSDTPTTPRVVKAERD
ncbi:hypothetical protein [Streptomyces sp. t39]|uniref:hypothetical protein n=1 Tax=Streptomyces sp. t39 TaxID=1828156 RepID=UPI0021C7C52D|nr:hypothetical protein [Streptomyces sp. t39]